MTISFGPPYANYTPELSIIILAVGGFVDILVSPLTWHGVERIMFCPPLLFYAYDSLSRLKETPMQLAYSVFQGSDFAQSSQRSIPGDVAGAQSHSTQPRCRSEAIRASIAYRPVAKVCKPAPPLITFA